MARRLELSLVFILISLLSACASSSYTKPNYASPKPSATGNACTLFRKTPNWYWEALDTYNRWGVPISVQMAIMQRESDFQAGARPLKKSGFFGSWTAISSAYGYAQALNGTWAQYQQETRQYDSQRDQFGSASDFIGWYCNKAHQQLGIPLNNAYNLYLAYHEGLNGYQNQTYRDKPWLMQVAQTVQARADQYRAQIAQCKYSLPVVKVNPN